MQIKTEVEKAGASLKYAMSRAGIACNEALISDSRLHNFQPANCEARSGWYIIHDWRLAVFGDTKRNIQQQWHWIDPEITQAEKAVYQGNNLSLCLQHHG